MSAVTSSFILLLCLATDASVALAWNPNGTLGIVSTQLMSSSNENGGKGKGNRYPTRSTSFRALSSYRMRQVEMAASQHILETKYSKSENAKLVPSKRTFTPSRGSSSPGGMFSDYSQPKMRPPSHNR